MRPTCGLSHDWGDGETLGARFAEGSHLLSRCSSRDRRERRRPPAIPTTSPCTPSARRAYPPRPDLLRTDLWKCTPAAARGIIFRSRTRERRTRAWVRACWTLYFDDGAGDGGGSRGKRHGGGKNKGTRLDVARLAIGRETRAKSKSHSRSPKWFVEETVLRWFRRTYRKIGQREKRVSPSAYRAREISYFSWQSFAAYILNRFLNERFRKCCHVLLIFNIIH